MTNLKNKVALVTGSARGIGKAIAERFGALGASVVVNYATSEGPAQETVAAITRLGGTAMAVQATLPGWPTSIGYSRQRSSGMAAWTS